MMNIIEQLDNEQIAKIVALRKLPEFQPGDSIRVAVKVKEGERSRAQSFEGVCIARSGAGLNENFTVRKISYGEGVERVFPIFSPLIDGVVVIRRGRVRRAKLYYLRGRRGKRARIAEDKSHRAESAVPQSAISSNPTEPNAPIPPVLPNTKPKPSLPPLRNNIEIDDS